jgi:hypothetical protein
VIGGVIAPRATRRIRHSCCSPRSAACGCFSSSCSRCSCATTRLESFGRSRAVR